MQVAINFQFDLGTAAGRTEFQRIFQHMLLTPAPLQDWGDEPLPPALDEPTPELPQPAPTSRRMPPPNLTSIPDDPVRAAAALAGRQAAAAKARAAKAAKAGQAPGHGQASAGPEPEDLNGPELPQAGGATNGADQADEDMGLDDPNMSPAEAKEQGLVLMRELFGAGRVAEMKAIQKRWGVAKFYDIPTERGHEFYRQAMQVMHETGLRK